MTYTGGRFRGRRDDIGDRPGDLRPAGGWGRRHGGGFPLAGRQARQPEDLRGRGGANEALRGDPDAPLQALIFDSVYDNYRGVICYVRIVNGTLKAGQDILFMATNVSYPVDEVGVFRPSFTPVDRLGPGEVSYVAAAVDRKSVV